MFAHSCGEGDTRPGGTQGMLLSFAAFESNWCHRSSSKNPQWPGNSLFPDPWNHCHKGFSSDI